MPFFRFKGSENLSVCTCHNQLQGLNQLRVVSEHWFGVIILLLQLILRNHYKFWSLWLEFYRKLLRSM